MPMMSYPVITADTQSLARRLAIIRHVRTVRGNVRIILSGPRITPMYHAHGDAVLFYFLVERLVKKDHSYHRILDTWYRRL